MTIVVGSRQTVFNVDDFGADPSGTNDSFPAFFAAIQQATKVSGIVFVPPGQYRISQTLNINNKLQIQGAGPSSSLIVGNLPNSSLFMIKNAHGVVLQHFGLLSSGGNTNGMNFADSSVITLFNLQLFGFVTAIEISNCGNFDATSINIWGHIDYGIRIKDCESDLFFLNVHANNLPRSQGAGIYLSNVSGTKWTNCDFIGGAFGVLMDLNTQHPNPVNRWNAFHSVDGDTVSSDPWHIQDALGLQMSECWSGTFPHGTGVWFGSGVHQVSVVNHQWQNGKIGVGNNGVGITIVGGIMGSVQVPISSSVSGEPVVTALRVYSNSSLLTKRRHVPSPPSNITFY